MDSAGLCLVLLSSCVLVSGQGACDSDTDCSGKYPCCSKFGYCGDGPGYCSDPEEVEAEPVHVTSNNTGCYLPHYELVGGDLPLHAGGGGVAVDPPEPVTCQTRCRDNPLCLWFTFEAESKLCFMKSSRGFLRRRSEVIITRTTHRYRAFQSVAGVTFTSGATFEDGCVKVRCQLM